MAFLSTMQTLYPLIALIKQVGKAHHISNPHVISGIFTSPPLRIAPIKLETPFSTIFLFDIFLRN